MTVVLTLRALPGVDETKALRPILKRLLRTYGMRCVALRPVHESQTIRRRDADAGLHQQASKPKRSHNMPSAAKYAGGGFITLDSLKGKPPLIEQIAVVKEETGGKYGDRLVLVFESGKQLSLNKTSVGNLRRDIDDNWDLWPSHTVKIFAGEVDFQSGTTRCVLVEGIDVDRPPPKPKPTNGGDMDNEIPF